MNYTIYAMGWGEKGKWKIKEKQLKGVRDQRSSSRHGCNSWGQGGQFEATGDQEYGKRIGRGTVYRTMYCNGRSGLV